MPARTLGLRARGLAFQLYRRPDTFGELMMFAISTFGRRNSSARIDRMTRSGPRRASGNEHVGRVPHAESLEERHLLSETPIQVLLLVGQSGMEGNGSNVDLRSPYDAPQADVWIWQDDLGQNVGWTSL